MKALLMVVAIAIAVSTGCSTGASESGSLADSPGDPCEEVDRQYAAWEREISDWAAQRDIAQDNLERASEEDYEAVDEDGGWVAPPTLEIRNQIANLESLMSDQVLRMAYLASDNPQCFSPGLVADAKVFIDRNR